MQAFDISAVDGGVEAVAHEGREAPVLVAEGTSTRIALDRLFLSPFNVRKLRSAQTIPQLAATIEAETLLNPLAVVPEIEDGKRTGRYGVVGGGRRLEALQYLAEHERIAVDESIACKVFDPARAVSVSLTENACTEPMHPADTVEAFKKMVDEGHGVADIAGRFGVSELTVQRRLKLASLAPRFLDLYRQGEIEPKALQALALTDDHAKQIAVWDALPSYSRSAYSIRSALTEDELQMDSKLARFVGLDAYEQAGGLVRRDLFGDEGDVFLCDASLVQQLAATKLEAAADEIRALGWKWVEVRDEFGYSEQSRFSRIYPQVAKLTPPESAAMSEVEDDVRALRSHLTRLEDEADGRELTPDEAELYDELETQIDELADLRAMMEDCRRGWSAGQRAKAGVVVTINHEGRLNILEGLVRAEDAKAVSRAGMAAPARGETGKDQGKGEYSQGLMFSMTAHRTAAVAAGLIDNPHVALVALVHGLVMSSGARYYRSPVCVKLDDKTGRIAELAAAFGDSQAAAVSESASQRWGERLPGEPAALFAFLLRQDMTTLAELLAVHVARSYDAIRHSPRTDHRAFDAEAAIEDALQLDMADWWTPTPVLFLEGVPKAKMIEAVTQACGEAEARPLAKMKKPEAIAAAAAKLEGKRWLPAPLRRVEPGVDAPEDAEHDEEIEDEDSGDE